MLARHRLVRGDIGAILNLLLSQRHIQAPGLPVHLEHGDGRDQHLPAAQPAGGVYRKVADGPGLIVEVQLIYGSKLAVRRSDRNTLQVGSFR